MKTQGSTLTTLCALALLAWPLSAVSATYDFIGSGLSWPGAGDWVAIDGVNDGDDGIDEELDFVGDEDDAGGYTYRDADYVYFRMRLDVGTIVSSGGQATFSDSHLVLIDVVGKKWDANANTGLPAGGLVDGELGKADYSFAWDSKSAAPTAHGLEMQVPETNGIAAWASTRMDDIDGNNAQKLDNDINGAGRTTDGYVQATDNVSTTSFETTTLLDFAVSWSYLETYTDLSQDQTWNVTFGSISNATDHNNIAADVAGGVNPADDNNTGWAPDPLAPAAPAPTSLWLLTLGFSILAGWRVRGRRQP